MVSIPLRGLSISANSTRQYAFSAALQVLTVGSYKLCVWLKTNGDSNASNDTICKNYVVSTTGIPELNPFNELIIFPNPFTDQLNIKSSLPAVASIFDIGGRLVLHKEFFEHEKFHTENLVTGIYFITISTSTEVRHFKVFKE